jgi:uncharacterized cupredoxin-like copper-binding protein
MRRTLVAVVAVLLPLAVLAQHDHGSHGKAAKAPAEKEFGKSAQGRKATRTVKIEMNDTMRFTPADLTVKQGEVVEFVATNRGKVLHEMVLGTMAELKQHAADMRKSPGMKHDEPYMIHVAPGKTGRMVWQFTRSGEFYYGCLVPGHFESGMIGKVTVAGSR